MAKQAKYESASCRISGLPDCVLCHIMSFLPTKDAVRTSILSTRWRHLFASMSTLDFYDLDLPSDDISNFKNFVDGLFFSSKQLSLECLRMKYYYSDDDVSRFYGWVCAALWRGVKELDLHSVCKNFLPTFPFTCPSLVTLKLDTAANTNVPTKVCLPNLKTLHLKDIEFSHGDSIHRLVSGCLVLEDLVMELSMLPNRKEFRIHSLSLKRLVLDFEAMIDSGRDFNNFIVINAPNLVYFKYIGLIAKGYRVVNMNSLAEADIRIDQFDDKAIHNLTRAATELLQAICSARSLHLAIEKAEMLFLVRAEPFLAFPNLLEFENFNCEDWRGRCLVEFLHCMPNLQTLHLLYQGIDRGHWFLPEPVPFCLLFNLKEIKISRYDGEWCLFNLVRYFLSNALFLEKLILGMEFLEKEKQLEVAAEVLRQPRKSKNCQFLTIGSSSIFNCFIVE